MRDWLFRHRFTAFAAVLVILPLLLMYVTGSTIGSSGPIENGTAAMTGWAQTGAGSVVNSVGSFSSRIGAVFSVASENFRLSQENQRLLGTSLKARRIEAENRELRLLLGLRESRPELKLLPAEVVLRDVNPFFRVERIRLLMAERREDVPGASVGNAVITSAGLVGRVTEVRRSFADVMLVSDHRSRVAVQVHGTGIIGMVVGSGRKAGFQARVQVPVSEQALQKDAVIVTSGHDRVFPRGIEVGYIADPEARRQVGPFMEYDIVLAEDPSTVDTVMVVTELPVAESIDAFGGK
ncbi:MAG TPA: rod shape-determining protein MreC [Myxococcota bacterium]|nr:rod shape-determining protein MreC [Myxococcota bacterium]HNZ03169.1 rod shape-determining protein MreC [Myxococcota bacterium]